MPLRLEGGQPPTGLVVVRHRSRRLQHLLGLVQAGVKDPDLVVGAHRVDDVPRNGGEECRAERLGVPAVLHQHGKQVSIDLLSGS